MQHVIIIQHYKDDDDDGEDEDEETKKKKLCKLSRMWGQEHQQHQQHAGLVLLGCVLLRLQLSYVAAIQLQSCIDGFVVHKDKIIRTEDSLKLGAVYLSEYEVGSRIDCIKWCCQTDNCDVFVFEDRVYV